MWKKKYKSYRVNKKHEWLMSLQASARNATLELFPIKRMRDARSIMKWRAG